jgi:hypothetical protein
MENLCIPVNVFVLAGLMLSGLLVGFGFRKWQIAKKNGQILELEREMVQAHAELLDAQREYCALESKIKDLAIPVISLSNQGRGALQQGERAESTGSSRKKGSGVSNRTA